VSNLNVIYCLQALRKTTTDSSQDSLRPFVIQRGISPNTDHIDKTCFWTEVRCVPGHWYRRASAVLLCSRYFPDNGMSMGWGNLFPKHDPSHFTLRNIRRCIM